MKLMSLRGVVGRDGKIASSALGRLCPFTEPLQCVIQLIRLTIPIVIYFHILAFILSPSFLAKQRDV